jgi:preprotein translocase subunit SecA
MIERAQKTVEQHHYSIRKRLLQYDDVGSKQREVIYALRNEAITSDTPKSLIFELIEEELEYRGEEFGILVAKSGENEKEIKDFYTWLMQTFPIRLRVDDFKELEGKAILKLTMERIEEAYQLKEEAEEPEALRRLERIVLISNIDRHYQDHLTEMEDLRQSVGLRGYGQKDPLVEYKNEAFIYFDEMLGRVRSDICSSIFRSVTNVRAFESMVAKLRQRAQAQGPADPDGEQPGLAEQAGAAPGKSSVQLPKVKKAPVRIANEPGRNEVVVIQRGPEKQEMKWKKAERLVKEEGWQLVGKA